MVSAAASEEDAVSGAEGTRPPQVGGGGSRRASPTDPLRAIFAEWGVSRALRRGERLHAAGEPLEHVYLLQQGWIGRTRSAASGEAAFTAVHIAGDVVAADGMYAERTDDDLHALTRGAALRLPAARLRAAVGRDDGAAAVLMRLLAAEAGFLREALFAVGRLSSTERLSVFVLQTFRRQVEAGLLAPDARAFDLPFTQGQLAGVTGMTPVHLNRVLRALREGGCLELVGGVARIGDMVALERAAGRA